MNQLAIGTNPPKFLPWRDAACLAFVYAGAPGQTVVSGRTTVALNLRNPAETFTVPAGLQGPTTDASIGGQPAWVADNSLTTKLSNSSIAIPAINATGSSVFQWAIGRFDASLSNFETLFCLGSGNDPALRCNFGSAGVSSVVFGQLRTVNSPSGSPPGNYVQGTPKRVIAYHSGSDAADYLTWGGSSSPIGATSTMGALTGAALFDRGNPLSPARAQGALAAWGVFTATAANAVARSASASALIAKLDAWALSVYGATAWTALTS